jgi:hypothetical protein
MKRTKAGVINPRLSCFIGYGDESASNLRMTACQSVHGNHNNIPILRGYLNLAL